MKSRGISWRDVFLASLGSLSIDIEATPPDADPAEVARTRKAVAAEVVAFCRAVADEATASFERDHAESQRATAGGHALPSRQGPHG